MDASWIEYLLKSSLLLSASCLVYYYLLRNEVSFLMNRLFLLLMIPLSFLLPVSPLVSPFRSLTFYPVPANPIPESAATAAPTSSLPSLLFIIYILGVLLFCLRILFHLFHLFRLSRQYPTQRLQNIVLVKVADPIPPFSFFNRIFLQYTGPDESDSLKQIISHESVHIRQFHSLDILLMELVVAIQWFNPLIWFYKKALKETHEYLADREVIAQGFNAEGYRLLLFEQHFGAKLFEFASNLKQSQIKRRMFMMNRMKTRGRIPYKFFLALPLVALLALAMARPRIILADVPATADALAVNPAVEQDDAKAKAERDKEEVKARLEEFHKKEKILKEKLSGAQTDKEKQFYKQSLEELYQKKQAFKESVHRQNEKSGQEEMNEQKLKETLIKFDEKSKYLKEQYAKAETAEEKDKIKKELYMLQQKRQQMLDENGMSPQGEKPSQEELEKKLQSILENKSKLKKHISKEKDPEKVTDLKKKFEQLSRIEEEIKIKLSTLKKKD